MNEARIKKIMAIYGDMDPAYINDFEERWNKIVGRLKRSGHNLNIPILPVEKAYKQRKKKQ